ncbi:hypothetical protein L1049_002117 [Liquidambar formosana]|uniref:RNase H type-1 domain-containing protein n=1 Tax=Liquidambar formosana TaxID=63359 RepID=A0AAP0R810_LIQFO
MAIRFALGFARDLSLRSIVVEGDSVEVIDALNSAASLVNSFGLLVEDIHNASRLFNEVTFSHVQREVNEVAHGLVRHERNIKDFCVWLEEVLDFVREKFDVDLYAEDTS